MLENAYISSNIIKIFNEWLDSACPKCGSSRVVPVIFGLIERKGSDFYDCDKIIGYLTENNLIENPGCCPDSYMNDKNEIPTKFCKECNFYFDYSEGY
jgi:hypothetical protein